MGHALVEAKIGQWNVYFGPHTCANIYNKVVTLPMYQVKLSQLPRMAHDIQNHSNLVYIHIFAYLHNRIKNQVQSRQEEKKSGGHERRQLGLGCAAWNG